MRIVIFILIQIVFQGLFTGKMWAGAMPSPQTDSPAGPTVLVVDDDRDVLRTIGAILADQSFRTILTGSADEAIAVYTTSDPKPDLILTDVVMPGMSGPMMVDHLLSLNSRLRVLFMSGYDERQVVQRYVVRMGFSLIPKPFSANGLVSAVRTTLNKAVRAEGSGS